MIFELNCAVVRIPLKRYRQIYADCRRATGLLHYIAVYHLRQSNSSVITDHVEGFRFDICRVHALPYQVIFL